MTHTMRRISLPSKKKKLRNLSRDANRGEMSGATEDVRENKTSTKLKSKREPLPMKMRAFPSSFWQEPNTSGIVLPTSYCAPMEDESDRICHSRFVGKANTDLLFSLFQGVHRDSETEKRVAVVKRGRPRKMKPPYQAANSAKDEDPYFTSAIVPVIQAKEEEKIAHQQQVLALISVSGENESYPISSSYAERLSDLVVNL